MKSNEIISSQKIFESLGAKPSISEERGLSLIEQDDLTIFSPGISTAGFAEIRMARTNPQRKVVATTIDEKGLNFAQQVIEETGFDDQIDTRLEDLRNMDDYEDDSFDFIYARLVLHYLSFQDLEKVLDNFYRTLRKNGKLFVVVRSVNNIPERDDVSFNADTQMTSIPHYGSNGEISYMETRYFHTAETISEHLRQAGFFIDELKEYQEQLFIDFMRQKLSPIIDHVIEVVASKG